MDISVYLQIQQFVINNIQDFDKGLEAALNKFNTGWFTQRIFEIEKHIISFDITFSSLLMHLQF